MGRNCSYPVIGPGELILHWQVLEKIALLDLLYAPPLRRATSCCINRFQAVSRIDMPFCGGEKMTLTWAQRQAELLRDCIVSPDVFASMVDRLCDFVVPYQDALEREQGDAGGYTYCISRRSFFGGKQLRLL
jgi:hypothetical protein